MEAARGRTRTGKTAVSSFKDRGDLKSIQLSASDVEQCTDDCANHVLKEPITGYAEEPLVIISPPNCGRNCSHTIFGLGGSCAERCEIVCARKAAARCIDGIGIQGVGERIDVSALKRTHDPLTPESIFVRFRPR